MSIHNREHLLGDFRGTVATEPGPGGYGNGTDTGYQRAEPTAVDISCHSAVCTGS